MTAMTLLRAMSAIDPEDIEAACRATGVSMTFAASSPVLTSEEAETAGFPVPYPKPVSAGKRYAIGGWAAAAACIALVAAAGLYFRNNDDYLTTPSGSEWLTEITGTAPAETVPTQGTEVISAGSAETGTAPAVTAAVTAPAEAQTTETGTQSPESSSAPAETDDGIPITTVTESTTASAVTSAITTAAESAEAAVLYTVPALIATSDGKGILSDYRSGIPNYPGEGIDYEIIYDADVIRTYLERQDPPVVLGSGRLSDADRDAILADPVLVCLRWQESDDRYTSYGFREAELSGSGQLHVDISMYSNAAAEHQEPWIYEVALLCKKSDVPAIKTAGFQLDFYSDDDTTGIENYMRYLESLSDDISVMVTG